MNIKNNSKIKTGLANPGKFMADGVLLAVTSLVMRTVAVSFSAYTANKAGAEGTGLFSLVMSIYGFAVTFATSGVNLASTRMVAEALGRNNKAEAKAAIRRCFVYAFLFGAAASAAVFLLSDFIGMQLLKDIRTIKSLKILALSLAPLSMGSAAAGYFTAVRRVYKNAVIAVFEQAVRIYTCVRLLEVLLPKGIEYACVALVSGGAVAEIVSFAFSFIIFAFDKRKHMHSDGSACPRALTSKLLSISLPVAFSAYARSALITAEHLLLPGGLRKSGLDSKTALEKYGIMHGMVIPVVLYPAALSGAFASLLIPEASECFATNNTEKRDALANRALRLVLAYSICAAGIMMLFSAELGNTIYKSAEAGYYIGLMAPLVPVMYIDSVTDAFLKGLGQQVYSMAVNITDSAVSVILILTILPLWGMKGYVIAIYACEILNTSLSLCRLVSVTNIRPSLTRWIAEPLVSIIAAGAVTRAFFSSIYGSAFNSAQLVLGIALTVGIYIILMSVCRRAAKKIIIVR